MRRLETWMGLRRRYARRRWSAGEALGPCAKGPARLRQACGGLSQSPPRASRKRPGASPALHFPYQGNGKKGPAPPAPPTTGPAERWLSSALILRRRAAPSRRTRAAYMLRDASRSLSSGRASRGPVGDAPQPREIRGFSKIETEEDVRTQTPSRHSGARAARTRNPEKQHSAYIWIPDSLAFARLPE
jgi:hypothetical protein